MKVEVVICTHLVITVTAAGGTVATTVAALSACYEGLDMVLMLALLVTRRLFFLVVRILAALLPGVLAGAMNLAILPVGTKSIGLPASVLLLVISDTGIR